MSRLLALGIVGLMLAVPAVSAASTYPQTGYDAGRTGAIPFEGPQTNDTAFRVQLPGSPQGQPVIDGDTAYIVTNDRGFEGLDARALWSIDLATGNASMVQKLPDEGFPLFPNSLVTDDLLLYQNGVEELIAFDVPSGEERWRATAMDPASDDRTEVDTTYDGSVVVGDRVYIGYYLDAPTYTAAGVLAVDLEDGERLWRWDRQMDTREEEQAAGQDLPASVPDATGGPDRVPSSIQLAADRERVYVYLFHSSPRQQAELWALDVQDGASLWDRHNQQQVSGSYGTEGWAVVTPERAYIRLDTFQALNPRTGETLWTSPAGGDEQGANAMGATGETVVGTSLRNAYRLEPGTGDVVWQQTLSEPNLFYTTGETVAIDDERAYAPAYAFDGEDPYSGLAIHARDLETGEIRWQWSYVPDIGYENINFVAGKVAYGPGVAIWGSRDGTVHVVGETDASLGGPEVQTERYPGEGEEVQVDASGAEPGAFGEATRYMVDWGDGTVSSWQASSTFTHAYNETGQHQARVYAGNDANQTSSTLVTMNVGEEEPNLVQTAFRKENQDMTFGVLGVALAVGGGAIGATKRYRKRSRLEEELEALETGYEETDDRPGECEAFLETRRARARSLVLDGVLTEEQGTIIQDRADELRRDLRTAALEDEFGFLPYSLVTKARQMLEDGRVTTLEVEAFESALDEVEGISEEQRTVVRERIEAWKARDEGGGGR